MRTVDIASVGTLALQILSGVLSITHSVCRSINSLFTRQYTEWKPRAQALLADTATEIDSSIIQPTRTYLDKHYIQPVKEYIAYELKPEVKRRVKQGKEQMKKVAEKAIAKLTSWEFWLRAGRIVGFSAAGVLAVAGFCIIGVPILLSIHVVWPALQWIGDVAWSYNQRISSKT